MRKAICSLLLCLATTIIAGQSYAQGVLREFPQGKWWTNKRIINQLNLTAEQQSRIETIWTQSRRTLIDLQAELQKRQLDLEELFNKDAVDEGAALEALDKWERARAALDHDTLQMRIRIKNLLSPDQQQILQTIAEVLRQQRVKAENLPPASPIQPRVKK